MIDSQEFKRYLDFAFDAYQNHNITDQAYRQDGKVPYFVHPLWCATMLVTDTRIPYKERELGFKTLILHDVLEDTDLTLPDWVEPEVVELIKQMTFKSSDSALDLVSSEPINIKLLHLADGLSSMYEEHVSEKRRSKWKTILATNLVDIESHYGNIRLVQIAKAILENTDW